MKVEWKREKRREEEYSNEPELPFRVQTGVLAVGLFEDALLLLSFRRVELVVGTRGLANRLTVVDM